MSWQSYVDDQLLATKMVKHAVICGHDGNIWAQTANFSVSYKGLKCSNERLVSRQERVLILKPVVASIRLRTW